MANAKKNKEEDKQDSEEDEEKDSSPTMVDAANKAADRLEKAQKALDKSLDRRERLEVERTLGGTADAGQPSEKKEISDAEYAKKVMTGEYNEPSSQTK